MKSAIKASFFLMIYLILFGITSAAITTLKNVVLRAVLYSVCILFHLVICAFMCYGEGKKSMKVRISNDAIRRRIVQTGEDLRYDKKAEYRTVNGFIMSLITTIPVIVVSLICLISYLSFGAVPNTLKVVTNYVSGNFYYLFCIISGVTADWGYAMPIVFIALFSISMTLGYYLGGRKTEKNMDKINETKRKIKGEYY